MLLPIEAARHGFLALVLLALAAASLNDYRYRRIPNWTVAAIILLYGCWALLGGQTSVAQSLLAALVAFLVSFPLYMLRLLGAGDSKLVTAVALFVGMPRLVEFAFVMSLVGGGLAAIVLASQPTRTLVMLQGGGGGDHGRDVPYGIAIAMAGAFIIFRPSLA